MPVPPVIQMYRYVMGSGGGLGNLLKASEEFQQTVDWVRYPTDSQTPTVSADSRPDPNGGTTADQVGFTANTSARLQQTLTLSASTQYTFSVYARAVSGSVDFRMRNVTLKAAEVKTATTTGGDGGGFTRFTYTFTTTTAGSYELALQNDTNATAKDVIFWGAMLNQGGTALDYEYAAPTTGGSAPAPAYAGFGDAFGGVTAYYSLRQFTEAETLNAIRVRRSSDDTEQDIGFDANGDLDTTALLAFVGGQNLLVQSNQFDTTWTLGSGLSLTSGQSGYDGSSDAWVYSDTSTGNSLGQTCSTSGVQTLSIYAKAGTADGIRLRWLGGSGGNSYFNIADSSTEAYSTTNTIQTKKEDVGSGWFRVSLTFNDSVNTIRLYVADGSSTSSTSGSIYIQDAQLEEGSTATTYNPTTTGIGGDGAVTTFYDQSGNGNDATNATETQQPLVVSGGTLVTENGKAAIDFDGVDDGFTTSLAGTSTFDFYSVIRATSGDEFIVPDNNSVNGSYYGYLARADSSTTIHSNYGTPSLYVNGTLETPTTRSDVRTLLSTGNQLLNVHQGADTSAWSYIEMFRRSGFEFDGVAQEIIIFNSDQSSNRGTVTTGGGTGIQGNINTYFDIV